MTTTDHFTLPPGAFASVAANTIETVKIITQTKKPADNAQSSLVCLLSNLLSAGGREENVAGGIAAVALFVRVLAKSVTVNEA